MKIRFLFPLLTIYLVSGSMKIPATYSYQLAVLKYNGGGDWYANPTSVPNLVSFCNKSLGTSINPDVATVEAGSTEIYSFPFIHMTGHGNVVFSASEAENLRNYCKAGGFIHIDDNYGMDKFIRKEIEKVFPGEKLVEIPVSHPVFKCKFSFPNGLPKIHEHDNKPPQGFGIFMDGRMVLFYSYECDLGDGWEDAQVHKDSEETRLRALKMGANLIFYALMGISGKSGK